MAFKKPVKTEKMEVDETIPDTQFMTQAEQQIFRNAQASKQMVFEVYKNVIGTLEEFESRTTDTDSIKMPRSMEIKPEYAGKNNNDIKRQLETQLFLLEGQFNSCDKTIIEEVKGDLQARTVQWIASRAELDVPQNDTDVFVAKLFQIISEGATSHPEEFRQPPGSIPNIGQEHIQHVLDSQNKASILDKEFRDNPDKTSVIPEVRSCIDIDKGAKRLIAVNPNAQKYLDKVMSSNLR